MRAQWIVAFGIAFGGASVHAQITQFLQAGDDAPIVRAGPSTHAKELYRLEPGEIVRASSGPEKGYWTLAGAGSDKRAAPLTIDGRSGSRGFKQVGASLPEARGYLDLPSNEVTTIYSEPGKTWRDCSRSQGTCIAWPHNDAEISITDSRMMEITDPFTGERRWQNFYRVQYRYTPRGKDFEQKGEGWISSQFVATSPMKEISAPVKAKSKEKPCPPPAPEVATSKTEDLEGLRPQLNKFAYEEIVKAIAPRMGQCLIHPPNKAPRFDKDDSPFDRLVVSHWKKSSAPKLSHPDGRPITISDLQAIDALARTVYGEMAVCWGQGSHYLKAVAAVAKNRANFVERNPGRRTLFVREEPISEKPLLAQVLSSKYQFSVWNPQGPSGGPNTNLTHVLCPPSKADQKFWNGRTPSPTEIAIWKQSVEIAAKAVLEPKEFDAETKNVKQYFYTSGLGSFMKGFTRVTPAIDGMRLSRARCIELWHKPNL